MSSAAVAGSTGEEGGEETVNIKQTIYNTDAWHGNAVLAVFYCSARCIARSGKSSGDDLTAPGDYRTGIPEGECSMFGMLEGGGGYVGSVFVFVVFF